LIPLSDIISLYQACAKSIAMAGLGRRTHYRKHLTDSVLYDLPEPKEYERIAKVVGTRGGNQFEIILAGTTSSKTEDSNRSGLALLPTKFHKLVWVKRNDYVIVQTGMDKEPDNDQNQDDNNTKEGGQKEDQEENNLESSSSNDPTETGIRFIISHILYKDQVKHLVSKGFWPKNDPQFSESGNDDTGSTTDVSNNKKSDDDGIVYNAGDDNYDDGIVYDEYDMENDDDLFVNTNRIARLEIQDSDEEEESSVEEE
jgi:probable RNA-binding protein EIF1AD